MSLALEDQLLVQCSRVKMGDEAIAMASDLLRQDLNWDYILESSILHGVAPLFHRGLAHLTRTLDIAAIAPSIVQEELQKLYLNNLARNRRLYSAVGEIFRAFKQADVTAIGLKDLVLARTVFPDMGLRPIGDVDILIHKEDYARVEQCLAGLGFTPLPSPDCPHILKYALGLHFQRPTDNVWIDMQWGILQLEWRIDREGNLDFETDGMWHNARPMTIDDYEILAFRPEDMLFHLCMHVEGHHYAELILFCDIAELLRYYGDTLEWSYLIALARKYGVEASIYYALLITQQLFNCHLPVSIQELEPTYFKANLFGPLFGNLATLHGSLDDIYRIASPPPTVMAQFETVVRRQAACAGRLYKEMDGLATALKNLDAGVVILDGAPSPMLFPSQALQPFSNLRLLVLEQDLPRLYQALSACGFEADQDTDVASFGKRCVFESADPATGDAPLVLDLRGHVIDDLENLLYPGLRQGASKKSQALKTLAGALRRNRDDLSIEAPVESCIDLIVLNPQDMVVYIASQVGKRQHERLFGVCSILEFFRGYQDSINWQQVAEVAERHGVRCLAHTGLLMANTCLSQPISSHDLARFNCSNVPPRMLQWARYGPATMDRYTSFKGLFFCLFTFLSVKGLGAKLKYLVGPSSERGKGSTFLSCAAQAIHVGTVLFRTALRGKRRYTSRDFVYWTEPERMAGGIDWTTHS